MSLRREKDFLIRMTEEMATMLAAVLGLRKSGQPEQALQQLDKAGGEFLGVPKSTLDRLDAASVIRLLNDPAKVRAYARLVREEAEILREMGSDDAAAKEREATLLQHVD